MLKYNVNFDEDFFHKFNSLSKDLKRSGYLFQNEGVTITGEDLAEWSNLFEQLRDDLEELYEEAEERVTAITMMSINGQYND